MTRPAKAKQIPQPTIWPRVPPIRERQNIPTSWIELSISEGKNRQVRRMTAAVGHPTLRLIRVAIGPWQLNDLLPGCFRQENVNMAISKAKSTHSKSESYRKKRPRSRKKHRPHR